MRVLVVGNGSPASATLRAFSQHPSIEIAALLTSESKTATPDGIQILSEELIRDVEAVKQRRLDDIDWLIVANSTTIIPARVLDLFQNRALNFHPGKLPEYAGLHTHQWAIRNGESSFAVTIHRLEATVDSGEIVAQSHFHIDPNDTGLSLFQKCMREGSKLLSEVSSQIATGKPVMGQPQDRSKRVLYKHADALGDEIDWTMAAESVRNFVRAGNYSPLVSPTYTAAFSLNDGTRLTVLNSEVGDPTDLLPGTLISVDAEGPQIACGDRKALRLLKAVNNGKVVNETDWKSLARFMH